MEIEYRKREVMWCLDREGPRICLRAVIANDLIETMKITSEDFFLEFDGAEAKEFLNLLLKLTKIEVPEIEIETPIVSEPAVNMMASEERFEQELVSESEALEFSKIPDPSEIIEVLKDSEISSQDERSLSNDVPTPKIQEEPTDEATSILEQLEELEESIVTPIPDSAVQDELTEETSSSPSLSDAFLNNFATASFFQDTPVKSPLEKLLEDEEKTEDKTILQEEIKVKIETEEKAAEEPSDSIISTSRLFSPDDLKTASFFSDFESQDIDDLIQEPETESQETSEEIPQPKFEPELPKEYITEAERKAKIEKERAERKKRLWELTRGF
ncbi:MAG: hypothetical protein ACFE9L_04020 [Candidatus Hodarchaeota archaeon]